MAVRLIVFAGSLRQGSYNKKLAAIAAQAAMAAGAEVTAIDLKDFPLPFYDQDIEDKDGLPAPARKLKELFKSHDGFLLCSPEYNSSISGVLKNTIDWMSRKEGQEPSLVAFSGKTAALMSASPGALGGLRALVHVRAILGNIGVLLLPGQVAVPKANEAFDETGKLKDPKQQEFVGKLAADLVKTITKLKA